MIIENSLISHNSDPTFFRGETKSCIDHIISNCPTKISNVRTHIQSNGSNYINIGANIINTQNAILSDHAFLSCNYNAKDISIPQQFKIIRNSNLLTREALARHILNNLTLNSIFSLTDPNEIANIIIFELSRIIEFLAPAKKIQCSKKYCPWVDSNYRIEANKRDTLHSEAIKINNPLAWRLYRNQRNLCNRLNKTNKAKYFSDRLNLNKNLESDENDDVSTDGDGYVYSDKKMWQCVKDITGTQKQTPPRLISFKNRVITKIKNISEIANSHFLSKINSIRSKFTINNNISPLQVLNFLIPPNKNRLKLPLPNYSAKG